MEEVTETAVRVLLSGSSGLVGNALRLRLAVGGHEVVRLVRRMPAAIDEVSLTTLNVSGQGFDAVVHLAGENIAAGRWTLARKRSIETSRVEGTKALVEALAQLPVKPKVWIGASAVGIYGNRGDEVLDEGSALGSGFLAEVCQSWEAAAGGAEGWGARVVLLRMGMVLTPSGGALARLLPLFRIGLGGPIGSGRQWMSWISLDDLTAIVERALGDERWKGPMNAVAPQPVRNREFAAMLGRVLGRPTWLRVPAVVLRGVWGEMADDVLLASARVMPGGLMAEGFEFGDATLEKALRRMLGPEQRERE